MRFFTADGPACQHFGIYYHAITHACDQYRILAGRIFNTESEQRTFSSKK